MLEVPRKIYSRDVHGVEYNHWGYDLTGCGTKRNVSRTFTHVMTQRVIVNSSCIQLRSI